MKKKLLTGLLLLLFFLHAVPGAAQIDEDRPLRVIAIFAHPDDGDIKMGATAAMMADAGHHVKFLSLTSGNAGHHEQGGGALAKRRRAEAMEAGARLGIMEYTVLDYHDAELEPKLHKRMEVIRQIRQWNADVVLGHRPNDYHPDHRYAGILVMDAAYMVIVPNIVTDVPALDRNPVFLYMRDRFQRPYPFQHDVVIGIDEHYRSKKLDALDAHESQVYEWLPWTVGLLDEVPEDPARRRQWLELIWGQPNIDEKVRERLQYWYGEEAADEFEIAETFEIAEYGHQPDRNEIRRIFPMLPD